MLTDRSSFRPGGGTRGEGHLGTATFDPGRDHAEVVVEEALPRRACTTAYQ
jgi:hypothetical protein